MAERARSHGELASNAAAFALLRALRPHQWPKNLIVFAALAFSAGSAWEPGDPGSWWPLAWRSLVLAGAWCAIASAMYLVNDLRDRDMDRLHPRKRYRPIAAGEVSPMTATVTAAILGSAALLTAAALDLRAVVILGAYAILMLAYSAGLKHVVVLDMLILSGGFVARAVSGAVVDDVPISPWLYVCTSAGALFLAASKRWAEARQLGPEAAAHRPALASYSVESLHQIVLISAAVTLVSYGVYTVESAAVPANGSMALTLPFVALAVFRYLLLLGGPRRNDAPDRILFTDRGLFLAALGFVGTAMAVLLW